MRVKDKKILVVGFARSGLSATNFLLERGGRVTITDTKTEEQLKDDISQLMMPPTLSLGGHRIKDFLDADFIVLSPGVPSNLPELLKASERNIPIYSEVELAYRFLKGRIIGVTGSNGKTTTATLIGELFKRARRDCVVAGNIGSPLIQWIETSAASTQPTFVVELSSFQLENIQEFKCDIALILNVSPDHQDRYDQFEDYLQAKEQIFLNQTDEDYAVINADNPFTVKMASRRPARVLLYSRMQNLKEGVFVRDGSIQVIWGGQEDSLIPVDEIRLRGKHNLENLLAATAAGYLSGLDREVMIETFRSFAGVEHRLEWVRELSGVTFYNDSKATNMDSAAQALQAFTEPLIVIMGGKDKGADFGVLRPWVSDRVRLLILLGTAADKISDSLGAHVATVRAQDMEQAVELAFEKASSGDVVLLSPGCASFDMFDDFEHRGRVFKESVNALRK
ncbi:MAG: UDP-N-acetylmuramoyl-L-alanine--D-glutamate ligase [Acidobacteria bacterium]|nr:MAG: UDP-N-acetylmuramoyl-L-alanine--D-glutamate ligase [Acidobacteriota bacterium]